MKKTRDVAQSCGEELCDAVVKEHRALGVVALWLGEAGVTVLVAYELACLAIVGNPIFLSACNLLCAFGAMAVSMSGIIIGLSSIMNIHHRKGREWFALTLNAVVLGVTLCRHVGFWG